MLRAIPGLGVSLGGVLGTICNAGDEINPGFADTFCKDPGKVKSKPPFSCLNTNRNTYGEASEPNFGFQGVGT